MMMMKVFVLLACVATASAECSVSATADYVTCIAANLKTNGCEVLTETAKCQLKTGCYTTTQEAAKKACTDQVAALKTAGEDCAVSGYALGDKTCDSGSMVAPSVGLIAALVAAVYRLF